MLQTKPLTRLRNVCTGLTNASLLITAFCVITSQSVFATEYRTVFLGSIGETYSQATGINNSGQIVGVSAGSDGEPHPFIWSAHAGMQILQTDSAFVPQDINENGVVAGYIDSCAAIWSSTLGLKTLGERGGVASSVNDSGYVTGWAGRNVYPYSEKAYIWSLDGTVTELCSTSESISWAFDINSHNQVAGTASSEAFVWEPDNGMQYLGTLGGSTSSAYAINDAGTVVGIADTEGDTQSVFCWTKSGGMSSAFTFDYFDTYYPKAINLSGTIVGNCRKGIFTWNANDGLSIISSGHVYGMNDAGQIAGWMDTDTGLKAVLWEPVPEPSSLIALACGLVGVLTQARKRRSI
jgi:probable HAF family extracellular repeat protein